MSRKKNVINFRRVQNQRRYSRRKTLRFEVLEERQMLAAAPIISEFLANNGGVHLDGDGNASDFVEIFNAGDEAAALDGWYLTDDPTQLTKWSFPSTPLDIGEYLLVYAAGLNTPDGQANLHTNFQLNSNGEYLALVQPDGLTVVSEFNLGGEDFPAQREDISHGINQAADDSNLLGPGAVGQVLVPTDDALGTTWTNTSFSPDGSWQTGPAGIGYDVTGGNSIPILQLDFDDRTVVDAANTESGFTPFTLSNNGSAVDGITVSMTAIGGGFLDDRDRSTPVDNAPDFTEDQIYDDFIFANGTVDGVGIEILLAGLSSNVEYEVKLWSFDSGSSGTRVSNWSEVSDGNSETIETTYTFDGSQLPTSNDSNTMTALVTSSPTGELLLRGVRNGGVSHGVFVNALQVSLQGISDLVATDITGPMSGVNSTAFMRFPFDLDAVDDVDLLRLEIAYDADFVAYLNGQEVARSSGVNGQPPAFDATAAGERSPATIAVAESINLTSEIELLVPNSANVLAIHGLNSSANDGNFLIDPQLIATDLTNEDPRYFTTPTPGSANGDGLIGFVGDTRFSFDRGFYDAPFALAITSDTPGSTIVYTTDGSLPSLSNGMVVTAADENSIPVATIAQIDTTTFVRAVALKDGYLSSNVDAHTYIFLADVLTQDPVPGFGDPLYPTVWQNNSYSGDYQVDPDVVAQWDDDVPDNLDFGIREGLLSIPTISVVMDHEDLWGASSGMYNHATSRGSAWRRPGSFEYFDPNSGNEIQVNAGVQMHGGASRDNLRTKKHSFRLVFNEEFGGPSQLNFPLFADSENGSYNTLVLKSFFTDGFPTRTAADRYSPIDSLYLRDTWMRDLQLAMGNVETHSTYAHLYINGLYWGLYSPVERPDDAFLSDYLGGNREDYDVVKDFNELFRGNKDAWNEMFSIANNGLVDEASYQLIQGNDPDGTPNPLLPNYLDVDNLIDFMVAHLYGGAEDWPHHNWYSGRDRVGETKGFQFFVWDQEIVLDTEYRDRTEVDNNFTPARLYDKLRDNAEFRLRFADRVQQHLFNDGPLTNSNAQQILLNRADEIEKAIIAESARWGDAREGEVVTVDSGQPAVTVPVMTVDLWRESRDEVLNEIIPLSHTLTISRFRADGLFPFIDASAFSQHGGLVALNFPLSMNANDGTIYYTLDGTDPRLAGGSISPNAIEFTADVPLTSNVTVTARALDGNDWSTATQADFFVGAATAGNLVVTEVNYHPHAPSSDEFAVDAMFVRDEFEFVELQNISNVAIDLTGVQFTNGISFDFTGSDVISLNAGDYVVVVNDQAAFEARYGNGLNVAGEYSQSLGNSGERIRLVDPIGNSIVDFSYDDNADDYWVRRADGYGSSLVAVDPLGDLNSADNWRASTRIHGTPGSPADAIITGIEIREILTHTDLPQVDAVEIMNTTGATVPLMNYFLSDASGNTDELMKFAIDGGAEIFNNDRLVLDENDFNPTPLDAGPNDFAFSSLGDNVYLTRGAANGPSHFVDSVDFGAAENGVSFVPHVTSEGRRFATSQSTGSTIDEANAPFLVGDVIVSELHYHPLSGGVEFIELLNRSGAAIDIFDPANPSNTWRLDGIGVQMPAGITLAINETMLIVDADPETYRTENDLPANLVIVGPFSGSLRNGGERLALQRPADPTLVDGETFVPFIDVDVVHFDDVAPWPLSADGLGDSLNRSSLTNFGSDPASWLAENPTPGTTLLVPVPPRVLSVSINSDQTDPPDLAKGPQPTSWSVQRAEVTSFVVEFSEDIEGVVPADLVLTNLGRNADVDPDQVVSLSMNQLSISGDELTITFDQNSLMDGVYSLEVLPTVTDLIGDPLDGNGDGTGGDSYVIEGNSNNKLFRMTFDYNGDNGTSVFDFSTFSYWFGTAVPVAPAYADPSLDGGVSVFDFSLFSANFGQSVTFPAAFAARFVESAPVESARVAEIRSIGFQEMVELNELMVVVPNEPNVRHEVVRQPAELRLENFEEERLGDEAVDQLFAQFGLVWD
jgi:hypothetical protein